MKIINPLIANRLLSAIIDDPNTLGKGDSAKKLKQLLANEIPYEQEDFYLVSLYLKMYEINGYTNLVYHQTCVTLKQDKIVYGIHSDQLKIASRSLTEFARQTENLIEHKLDDDLVITRAISIEQYEEPKIEITSKEFDETFILEVKRLEKLKSINYDDLLKVQAEQKTLLDHYKLVGSMTQKICDNFDMLSDIIMLTDDRKLTSYIKNLLNNLSTEVISYVNETKIMPNNDYFLRFVDPKDVNNYVNVIFDYENPGTFKFNSGSNSSVELHSDRLDVSKDYSIRTANEKTYEEIINYINLIFNLNPND